MVFPDSTTSPIYELKEVVIEFIMPIQNQARENHSLGNEHGHKAPPIVGELWQLVAVGVQKVSFLQ